MTIHGKGGGPKTFPRGLTPARRAALDILIEANRPVGAYEMIDLMADARQALRHS